MVWRHNAPAYMTYLLKAPNQQYSFKSRVNYESFVKRQICLSQRLMSLVYNNMSQFEISQTIFSRKEKTELVDVTASMLDYF